MRKYFSLNEASVTNPILAFGKMKVYYMKNDTSRDYGMGLDFVRRYELLKPLAETHTLLGQVNCVDLNELYGAMQGESWSPNGEATTFLKGLGLYHTSMSVGDIIELNGKFFFCDSFGFKVITEWQNK